MSITSACAELGYSKQAYYKQSNRLERRAFDEYLIVELIHQKREIWKHGSGRNLLASLQEDFKHHSIKIGRDRFFDLLRRHQLLVKRKSKRAITTHSYHFFRRYPNLIKGLDVDRPHQVWVSDITYIWVREEEIFLYLFLLTDQYSRKIIGYKLAKNMRATHAISMLKMALGQLPEQRGNLIHHSDRGIQYCSYDYTDLLMDNTIGISMTENSDPLENSIAERVNKTLKEEFMEDYKNGFASLKEANHSIPRIIDFYNQKRPHRSLDMMTPNQAHLTNGKLKKHWKNYYRTNN